MTYDKGQLVKTTAKSAFGEGVVLEVVEDFGANITAKRPGDPDVLCTIVMKDCVTAS